MRHGEGDSRQIKILITVLGIFLFLAVVVFGYKAIRLGSPEIMNNCISKAVLESVENLSAPIPSEEIARDALKKITGVNVTFLYNTLDACDVRYSGYVYLAADNITYAVCGDGQIYRYRDMCAKKRDWGSLVSMFNSKNANIVIRDK